MPFFKVPEVDAKYKSLMGDADPIVQVVIGHNGPFSEIPLAIADKMFADGDKIELKKADKTEKQEDKGTGKGK